MFTPKRISPAGSLAFVAPVFFLSIQAQANCLPQRANEVVCGDKRICVSGQANAAEGFYDKNTCVWQDSRSPVCGTLSHLADVYVKGGDKNNRPANTPLIEVASAYRLPKVSAALCKQLGIPTSIKDVPAGTPRPPGGTWCRSNAARGGAPRSTHQACRAMDILVPGMPGGGRQAAQRLADELYKGQKRGINVYPSGRAHVAWSNEYFYSHYVYPNQGDAPRKRQRRSHR
jgi:hypothetical protein